MVYNSGKNTRLLGFPLARMTEARAVSAMASLSTYPWLAGMVGIYGNNRPYSFCYFELEADISIQTVKKQLCIGHLRLCLATYS
jgi:hypothetical protein